MCQWGGDHQPPLITNASSGHETPVHIMSKDKDFLNLLDDYGFENRMTIEERNENNITHSGMYYILLRSLIKQYGEKDSSMPPYLKDGIIIN